MRGVLRLSLLAPHLHNLQRGDMGGGRLNCEPTGPCLDVLVLMHIASTSVKDAFSSKPVAPILMQAYLSSSKTVLLELLPTLAEAVLWRRGYGSYERRAGLPCASIASTLLELRRIYPLWAAFEAIFRTLP